MSKPQLLSPVMRRVLFIGTNQLSRAALHAPTRIVHSDALADLKSAEHELARLIRCLQLQSRKESAP